MRSVRTDIIDYMNYFNSWGKLIPQIKDCVECNLYLKIIDNTFRNEGGITQNWFNTVTHNLHISIINQDKNNLNIDNEEYEV
jgi:hypothetical protein